jgi:hypothetical protein
MPSKGSLLPCVAQADSKAKHATKIIFLPNAIMFVCILFAFNRDFFSSTSAYV